MLVLQIAEFPGLKILLFPIRDLIEKFLHRSDQVAHLGRRLCRLKTFFQSLDRCESILDEFTFLKVIIEFLFLGIQKSPRKQEIELASGKRELHRRCVGESDFSDGISRHCLCCHCPQPPAALALSRLRIRKGLHVVKRFFGLIPGLWSPGS